MSVIRYAMLSVILGATLSLPASAFSERAHDPLRFFEGSTESVSVVKAILSKPYRTRALGIGEMKADGSLDLVQRVERDGHPTTLRRWLIREVGPGRFTGSMSEAVGPVTIEEVDGRFRFRFTMKGHLAVEQWLTPEPGWRWAKSTLTIKRFGIKVGSAEGWIRKTG